MFLQTKTNIYCSLSGRNHSRRSLTHALMPLCYSLTSSIHGQKSPPLTEKHKPGCQRKPRLWASLPAILQGTWALQQMSTFSWLKQLFTQTTSLHTAAFPPLQELQHLHLGSHRQCVLVYPTTNPFQHQEITSLDINLFGTFSLQVSSGSQPSITQTRGISRPWLSRTQARVWLWPCCHPSTAQAWTYYPDAAYQRLRDKMLFS